MIKNHAIFPEKNKLLQIPKIDIDTRYGQLDIFRILTKVLFSDWLDYPKKAGGEVNTMYSVMYNHNAALVGYQDIESSFQGIEKISVKNHQLSIGLTILQWLRKL